MPVRMWWKIFQTWMNFLIQGFLLQLKMICWSTVRSYIVLCWDFLRKEKGKYTVTLINGSYLILPRIQHKVVVVVFFCIAKCRLANFLQLKLWARIPLQTGESPLAVVYGGRTFSQKRWPDLCCDFEKEEDEKNNFSSKIRENIVKSRKIFFKNWAKK